jgi:hypothetical protein
MYMLDAVVMGFSCVVLALKIPRERVLEGAESGEQAGKSEWLQGPPGGGEIDAWGPRDTLFRSLFALCLSARVERKFGKLGFHFSTFQINKCGLSFRAIQTLILGHEDVGIVTLSGQALPHVP